MTILTDWSRHVYPLAPLQHKKTFLNRLLRRDDLTDPEFAAVVLSTCAVTVSTLRRRSFHNYPSVTVEACVEAIERERMLSPHGYSLGWSISNYNIACSIRANSVEDIHVYRHLKDAMAGVQWLVFHDKGTKTLHDEEITKRLYWFVAAWQLHVTPHPTLQLLTVI